MIATAAPAGDENFDLELFILELEHQIQSRVRPELQRLHVEAQCRFEAELAIDPSEAARRARIAQEQADYLRRKERRRYVESGEAATATRREHGEPASSESLASDLAKRWRVPMKPSTTKPHDKTT